LSKEKVIIPFNSESGIVAGRLIIPPETFEPGKQSDHEGRDPEMTKQLKTSQGCWVSVNQSGVSTKVQDADPLACDPELEITSIAVQLEVGGGCSTKDFKKPVQIELNSKVRLLGRTLLGLLEGPSRDRRTRVTIPDIQKQDRPLYVKSSFFKGGLPIV